MTNWSILTANDHGEEDTIQTVNDPGGFHCQEYGIGNGDAAYFTSGPCFEYECFYPVPGAWTVAGVGPASPTAVNETAQTSVSTPVFVNIAHGAEGKPTSAAPISKPMNGTVTGFPGTTVLYTPATGYTGQDSFQFTLSNAGGTSNTATATISVGANPPVSANETASSQNRAPVSINLLAGSKGGATSAALAGSPMGGTVTGFPSTTVTFTPTGSLYTPWGFQFTLANSAGSSNTSMATVWPGIVSTQTKTFCSGMAEGSDYVANAFEGLSIGLEGGSAKQIAENVGASVAVGVFSAWVSNHDQVFGSSVGLSIGIHEFAEKALKHFTKTNPFSIVAEVDSLIFSGINLMANVCVDDPPDQNYTVVARPVKLSPFKTGNSTVDQLQIDYFHYISVNVAVVHAAERWQGATLAQAPAYAALQLKAYKRYLKEQTAVENTLKTDNLTMASVVPTFNISSFPGGAAAMAADFNLQCGAPLPGDLKKELLLLGMSQTQIASYACTFAESVTPASISTNAQGALQSNPFP